MNANVPMIDVGMASVAMSVVRQSRMNSRIGQADQHGRQEQVELAPRRSSS